MPELPCFGLSRLEAQAREATHTALSLIKQTQWLLFGLSGSNASLGRLVLLCMMLHTDCTKKDMQAHGSWVVLSIKRGICGLRN